MPIGPGKYDDLCTYVREQAQAAGAIVIVLDGLHGYGFSMQGTAEATLKVCDLLDSVSAQIRESLKEGCA